MDWTNLPEGTPVWLIVIVVLTTLGLTLSEKATKLPGVLGAAARWWNNRQVREVKNKRSLETHLAELVEKRVELRMEGVDGTIEDLRGEVEQLRADLHKERNAWRQERAELIQEHATEIDRLRDEDKLKWRYILHVAGRLREYRLWAVEHGHELPPPKIPGYFKWAAEQRARNPREPPDDTED